MRSDTVTKGMQQAFPVQCAGNDTRRTGPAVDRNCEFL